MDEFAEDIARVRAQQEIDRLLWFHRRPEDMSLYIHAHRIMQCHGSLHWDGWEHTDASWDGHHVRHVFGVLDDARWLEITVELERLKLACLCSLTGCVPENAHQEALDDWVELSISMRGVLHLATILGDPPAQGVPWWCSDCERTCLTCGQPLLRPLSAFCGACLP